MSKKVVRKFGCSLEAGMHKVMQQCLSLADNMADGNVSRNVLKIRILFVAQHFWHKLCLLLCETSETELV